MLGISDNSPSVTSVAVAMASYGGSEGTTELAIWLMRGTRDTADNLFRLPTQSASVNNAVRTFLLEP